MVLTCSLIIYHTKIREAASFSFEEPQKFNLRLERPHIPMSLLGGTQGYKINQLRSVWNAAGS